jgi:hypothetical protein
LPCHIGRSITGEENRKTSKITRNTKPTHWNYREHGALPRLRLVKLIQIAGRNPVNANIELDPFDG